MFYFILAMSTAGFPSKAQRLNSLDSSFINLSCSKILPCNRRNDSFSSRKEQNLNIVPCMILGTSTDMMSNFRITLSISNFKSNKKDQ